MVASCNSHHTCCHGCLHINFHAADSWHMMQHFNSPPTAQQELRRPPPGHANDLNSLHVCSSCLVWCVQHKLQLSYLCLAGLCLSDTEAAAVSTISGLRELELHNAPELTPYGIKHLTELQQLTRLVIDAVGCRRGVECFLLSNSKVSCAAGWVRRKTLDPNIKYHGVAW